MGKTLCIIKVEKFWGLMENAIDLNQPNIVAGYDERGSWYPRCGCGAYVGFHADRWWDNFRKHCDFCYDVSWLGMAARLVFVNTRKESITIMHPREKGDRLWIFPSKDPWAGAYGMAQGVGRPCAVIAIVNPEPEKGKGDVFSLKIEMKFNKI